MNLILVGYRGTGKSTVAQLLASRLKRETLSTDAMIIEKIQMPIPEIVEKLGWDHFRDLETAVCQNLRESDNLVVDTGGGVIIRSTNLDALKPTGLIFWLTATVDTISNRIADDTQRPSLTTGKTFTEEIEEILKERTPKYEAAADFVVETDACLADQVANQVLTFFQEAQGLGT